MNDYRPNPINTATVELTDDVRQLTERLAEHAHDVWAAQRLADGWRYGPERNDAEKQHPCLVSYAELPESEKEYDRNAAMETLKAIVALGYRIEKAQGGISAK
jgi:ryanodine receptor 2